jgi:hypothetical protein
MPKLITLFPSIESTGDSLRFPMCRANASYAMLSQLHTSAEEGEQFGAKQMRGSKREGAQRISQVIGALTCFVDAPTTLRRNRS